MERELKVLAEWKYFMLSTISKATILFQSTETLPSCKSISNALGKFIRKILMLRLQGGPEPQSAYLGQLMLKSVACKVNTEILDE